MFLVLIHGVMWVFTRNVSTLCRKSTSQRKRCRFLFWYAILGLNLCCFCPVSGGVLARLTSVMSQFFDFNQFPKISNTQWFMEKLTDKFNLCVEKTTLRLSKEQISANGSRQSVDVLRQH